MKIYMHTYCYKDSELNSIVSDSPLLLEQINISHDKSGVLVNIDIDTDSEAFDYFVKYARNDFKINMIPVMSYTKEELAQFNFFELKVLKVLRQQKVDVKFNTDQWEATPFLYPTTGSRIKLIDKIYISDLKGQNNTIYCYEPYQEFVLHEEIAKSFRDANLTGFETRPIINPVTDEPYTNYYSLYSDSILPPVYEDITVYDRKLSKRELAERQNTRSICLLGTEIYQTDGHDFADFNRTAEGFIGGWSPEWIVTATVKTIYEQKKLKGWQFLPVFETGHDLYPIYLKKWRTVLDKIKTNSHIRLER